MYYRYVYSHCIHGLFYCTNWNPPWFARNMAMAIQGWSWSGRKYRGLLLHICLAPSAPWQNALRSKGILSSHLHFNRHRIEVLIFKIWEDAWTKKTTNKFRSTTMCHHDIMSLFEVLFSTASWWPSSSDPSTVSVSWSNWCMLFKAAI